MVGLVCLVLASAMPTARFASSDVDGDVEYYERRANQMLDGEIPYHDFYFEYPPAASPALLLPKLSNRSYAISFRAEQAALLAVTLVLTTLLLAARRVGLRRQYAAAILVGLTPLLLGEIAYNRFDLWPAVLVDCGLAAYVFGRQRAAFAVLAVATAAKVYPVVVTAVALLVTWRREGLKAARNALLIWCLVGGLILLPFAVVGFGGLGFSFYTLFTRGLQTESLGASILLGAHQLGLYRPIPVAGLSNDLGGTLADAVALAQSVVEGIAVAAVLLLVARGRKPLSDEVFLTGCAAAVTAFVAFGKVLSPQYLVWLVPLVPLVAGRVWAAAAALFAGALALTNLWSPEHFRAVAHLEAWGWVVLARNVVLLALYALLLAWLMRATAAEAEP